MKEIHIDSSYITLGQLLKKAHLISSGGEAKPFLMYNQVKVNREKEGRRGRKVYPNDIIEIGEVGKFIIISE